MPVLQSREQPAQQDESCEALRVRGWAALPQYRIPDVPPTLEEARAWCQRLTETHYENFHVASWFLPKRLRPHFQSIYAYCRVSDDLGDEVGDWQQSLALLDQWNEELDACYRGQVRHPVFVALAATIAECGIPKQPFADLLMAFKQDQVVTRFETREEVLAYCRYSANPVGHLVLYAAGYQDPEWFRLADFTCSALQLANFLQDVREDHSKGRIYIPLDDMKQFGVDEATIHRGEATEAFRNLMRYEVDETRKMFALGAPLIGLVDRELAVDLDLFTRGGLEILNAIEARNYDVLSGRPSISKWRKGGLLIHAVAAKLAAGKKNQSQRRGASL